MGQPRDIDGHERSEPDRKGNFYPHNMITSIEQYVEFIVDYTRVRGLARVEASVDTRVPTLEDPLLEEAAALRNVPLLASLDSARLKLLAFTGDRLEYSPGDILFRQGDEGEEAYVILAGNADIVVERELSRVVLYSLGPGQMIGELAMLCDTPRSATARAKTRLTALRLNRKVFFETMRQDPAFSFKVARDLGERLVRTTEEISLPGQSE